VQRTPEVRVESMSTSSELASPVPTSPTSATTVDAQAASQTVQRTTEFVQRTSTPQEANRAAATSTISSNVGDSSPFRPINRYRDPRVLARSTEASQATVQSDLPLTQGAPAAILPQARVSPPLPLATPRVQRTPASTGNVAPNVVSVNDVRERVAPATVDAPTVQRRSESATTQPTRERAKSSEGKSVRRAPLPLAKKRPTTEAQESIQRYPDHKSELFIGASAANSMRGTTSSQSVGASNGGSPGSSTTESESKGDVKNENSAPDLDRLARAILPTIKQMLAIERDRKNMRSIF
jgi:hypothetical protein